MLVVIGLLAGAYYGYSYAKKREGTRLDKLQYSAVYESLSGCFRSSSTWRWGGPCPFDLERHEAMAERYRVGMPELECCGSDTQYEPGRIGLPMKLEIIWLAREQFSWHSTAETEST